MLTDLAMPRADGFALITHVRAAGLTPSVVLSVRGGDADKVRALHLGAHEFVVKPFSMPELLARIRAEFAILELLTRRAGRPVTFDQLIREV